MKRFLILVLLIGLNFSSLAFADPVNTVTLTSYYPAPFGAYDRLRLVPRDNLGTTCTPAQEGILYVNDDAANVMYQCRLGNWEPIGDGLWEMKTKAPNITKFGCSATIDQYYLRRQIGTPGYWDVTKLQSFVGIGTDDPTTYLHISSNANNSDPGISPIYIRVQNLNVKDQPGIGPGAQIAFAGPANDNVRLRALFTNNTLPPPGTFIGSSLGFFLREQADPNLIEQFRMMGNGYFGIRDTAPSAILELAGNALIGPPVANSLPYLMISSNNVAARNGDILTITANGLVGINTAAPGQLLDVNGNIRATTLILTSDATLKKDIAPVKNALDKISRLNGVSFEWKDTSQQTDGRKHLGVLAQEVEKIFPESVYGQEGAKAVDYPSLIAPLIEAVKELKNQNQAMDQQLKAQSLQIHEQQQQIESLKNSRTSKEPVLTP